MLGPRIEMHVDAIETLTRDHLILENHFREFDDAEDPYNQRVILNNIIRDMATFCSIEQTVLYPQITKHLLNGQIIATTALCNLRKVRELLYQLDKWLSTKLDHNDWIPAEWPAFPFELISSIRKNFIEHAREEQKMTFVALRKNFTQDRLFRIGDRLERTRRSAPTRPHKSIPTSSGIVSKIVRCGIALFDRAKDSRRPFEQYHASDGAGF